MELLATLNYVLALGSIGVGLFALVLFVAFFLRDTNESARALIAWITPRALWGAFGFSLFAAAMTLVYSDYLGIEPCSLCWWQRVFLYPQVILFGAAAWKKDSYIAEYSIVLSFFGAGVALYQHFLQIFPGSLPCPSTGVSCAQRFLFEFGFVTYPLMAFALFTLLMAGMLIARAGRH
jgi:disulfide bond formation protein DsbB